MNIHNKDTAEYYSANKWKQWKNIRMHMFYIVDYDIENKQGTDIRAASRRLWLLWSNMIM